MSTGMIEPFVEAQRREGCISYGLSSYGYDARVADEFKIFTNVDSARRRPQGFRGQQLRRPADDVCIIPPNSFALARTVEYFRIPRDVLVICLGKSTYARCGIIVNVTPLEPGWEGHVTLEFSNTTPLPAKIYANEGACQFLFLKGNEPCETSYADRAGKYMGQKGVTLPKLELERSRRARRRRPAGHRPRSLRTCRTASSTSTAIRWARLPNATAARIDETVSKQWGDDLIASWNKHGWIDAPHAHCRPAGADCWARRRTSC